MIDILLPTYNGEKYLRQLIESIINQTFTDWRLIIRDDGSKDDTVSIVKEYVAAYGDKILLMEDQLGNLGTSCSNDLLMHLTDSPYFMFCDQDDIWEPNKIEVCLNEMRSIEREHPNVPILVCSDACCVDENNNLICESFFKSQKFIDTTDSLYKMLALNIVQGSTALMNDRVRSVVSRIPRDYLHDAWVASIVKYYGVVSYIHKPLLQYRQHENNVLGAMAVGPRYEMNKIKKLKTLLKSYHSHFKELPFRLSFLKWLYYKCVINLKRCFI